MTKSSSKTPGKAKTATGFAPADLSAINSELMTACTQACQTMMDKAAAMNAEMLRFARERLEADVKTMQALPEITDWDKALSHQTDFMRSAVDAYTAELPKIMQQTMDSYTAIWTPLSEVARTAARTETKRMADAES
ncbi:MAG: hypothetical protein ACI82N_001085 [Maricaulis sp.]|jgi:hypothetical protein